MQEIGTDNVDLSIKNCTRKFLDIMEECVLQQELKRRQNLPRLTKNVVWHIGKGTIFF